MTKMHIYVISFAAFLSIQVHAGMEQTNACHARIKALETEITSLQNQVNDIQAKENNLCAKCSDLKTRREKFSELWFIPNRLLKWKQSSFDKKINKVNGEIAVVTKNRENAEGNLQTQRSELRTEKAKLKNYRIITITSIKIYAYGKWDPWPYEKPEIQVEMGYSVIARGAADTSQLDSSLYEDATSYDNLYVYDKDLTGLEYMGAIPLKKSEIPLGVSGDSEVRTLKGQINKSSSLGFSYTIKYEVEY